MTDREGSSLADELKRLEEIVGLLESQPPDLDRALQLFEEGVERLRQARARLAEAELSVKQVMERADGTLKLGDLDG